MANNVIDYVTFVEWWFMVWNAVKLFQNTGKGQVGVSVVRGSAILMWNIDVFVSHGKEKKKQIIVHVKLIVQGKFSITHTLNTSGTMGLTLTGDDMRSKEMF